MFEDNYYAHADDGVVGRLFVLGTERFRQASLDRVRR
jgi:hypothetical protein